MLSWALRTMTLNKPGDSTVLNQLKSDLAPLHHKKGGENLRQKRTHATSVILTEDLHKAVKRDAKDTNHSMSDIIRDILTSHYESDLPHRRGAIWKVRYQ